MGLYITTNVGCKEICRPYEVICVVSKISLLNHELLFEMYVQYVVKNYHSVLPGFDKMYNILMCKNSIELPHNLEFFRWELAIVFALLTMDFQKQNLK